jgi:Bacterial transcriptional activator domain
LLREALTIWRGDPLADLVGAPFADRERARLEDERLDAAEDRIEAELATGDNSSIRELEELAARNPYRERPRRLLILALYRAGRQADALNAYRQAARVLRDDLGLEPSKELRELELAVLRQDPGLDLQDKRPSSAAPSHRGRVAAGALLVAVAAGSGVALVARGGSGKKVIANHAAAFDSRSAKVTEVVPVGLRPSAIASLGSRIFVAGAEDNAVLQLDGSSGRRVRSIPTGGTVTSLSAAGRFLWAVHFRDREVLRIPFDSVGEPVHVLMPHKGTSYSSGVPELPTAVAATTGGAWIGTDRGRLFFARAGGGLRLVATVDLPIRAVAYAPPFVWLAAPRYRGVPGSTEAPGELVRFDLRTQETESVPVGIDPSALAVVGDGVWVATELDGEVFHVDDAGKIATIVDLDTESLAEGTCSGGLPVGCPGTLATSGHFLWAPSARDRTIYRVDTRANRWTRIATQGAPIGVASSAGDVWVAAD